MVEISESVEFDRSAALIWSLLSQPELVASCIPGATILPDADGQYSGTVSVKFGPTVVLFKGQCSISYDHENRVLTIEGRGIDSRGASRALARGTVRLTALSPSTSLLALQGQYDVNGPLQDFASSGGVHLVRAILQDFAKNLEILTASPRPETDNMRPAPAPISAAVLARKSLIIAFRSWIAAIVRRAS